MSDTYIIGVIAVMAVVTALLRFLPFILFDHGENLPKWISYLGKVLPPAVISMLLVYCLRNISFLDGSHGLPELICVGVAVLLHSWKRNTLLSIGVSTLLYMVLIQSGIFGI
ncbi:MAG: branched-chain amino acid transporter permease [Acutalibacteraceae bacterium]